MPVPRPAAEDFAATVDEIVAQLRKDPVLVEDIMSNGHTAEVKAALDAKADAAQVPVYVVLTRTPKDAASDRVDEELVSLLHARLGEDGVYYVATSQGHGSLEVWGDIDPSTDNDAREFQSAQWAALAQIRDVVEQPKDYEGRVDPAKVAEAGVTLDIAGQGSLPTSSQTLTEEQVDFYNHQTWLEHPVNIDRVEPPGVELIALIATAVSLVVAVVAYRLLQAVWALGGGVASRSGRGRTEPGPPRPEGVDPERLRPQITRTMKLVDRRLPSSKADPGRIDLAQHSRDAAVRLQDSDQVLDVVGALVLARTAAHALSGSAAQLYRCCYLNPLHGEADQTTALGSGLTVPVCARCHRHLETGQEPDALIEVRRRARDLPYYVGDTVWAETGFGAIENELWAAVERRQR